MKKMLFFILATIVVVWAANEKANYNGQNGKVTEFGKEASQNEKEAMNRVEGGGSGSTSTGTGSNQGIGSNQGTGSGVAGQGGSSIADGGATQNPDGSGAQQPQDATAQTGTTGGGSNQPGTGNALIVDKKIQPTEEWINKEIDQMSIDADNIAYYNYEYWLPAVKVEIENGYAQKDTQPHFMLENQKQVAQLEQRVKNKCYEIEFLTKKIEAQIQSLELSLLALRADKAK